MNTILFDIETGPLPESELAALLPPFDPAEVKTGKRAPQPGARGVKARLVSCERSEPESCRA
jgi:hypothetical protein